MVDGYVISYHVSSAKQYENYYYQNNNNKQLGSLTSSSSDLISNSISGSSSSTSSIDKQQQQNDDWQSVTISSPSTSSFTIRNLRCGTEYICRIEAFNEMGSGRPSDLLRFSTLGSGRSNRK